MPEEETYLGGLRSASMSRGWMKSSYGVYATTTRIFGVGSAISTLAPAIGAGVGGVAGVAVGSAAGTIISQRKTAHEGTDIIEELQQKKDFEISAREISKIELKHPGSFRPGHLLIISASGDNIKVSIQKGLTKGKAFLEVTALIREFCKRNPTVQLVETS